MDQQRIVTAIAIVVIAVGSFIGGIQYNKKLGTTATANAAGGMGQGGFGGGMQSGERPTFGTVKSISGNTIVITSSMTSSDITVTLTSSTTITNATGATATASDVAVGDTVAAFGSTSGAAVTATKLQINPTMGGAPASTITAN